MCYRIVLKVNLTHIIEIMLRKNITNTIETIRYILGSYQKLHDDDIAWNAVRSELSIGMVVRRAYKYLFPLPVASFLHVRLTVLPAIQPISTV